MKSDIPANRSKEFAYISTKDFLKFCKTIRTASRQSCQLPCLSGCAREPLRKSVLYLRESANQNLQRVPNGKRYWFDKTHSCGRIWNGVDHRFRATKVLQYLYFAKVVPEHIDVDDLLGHRNDDQSKYPGKGTAREFGLVEPRKSADRYSQAPLDFLFVRHFLTDVGNQRQDNQYRCEREGHRLEDVRCFDDIFKPALLLHSKFPQMHK